MCGEMSDENGLLEYNSGDCFLYHDCAPLHPTLSEPDFLPRNKMTIVICPLYSFDLVPYDFLFFPELRVALDGVSNSAVHNML